MNPAPEHELRAEAANKPFACDGGRGVVHFTLKSKITGIQKGITQITTLHGFIRGQNGLKRRVGTRSQSFPLCGLHGRDAALGPTPMPWTQR